MRKLIVLLLIFSITMIFSELVCNAAESPKDYYKGERVVLVVPYTPGGGFDTYARVIAPFLSKEMGATIIVNNKPGGGGYRAANWMYLNAPRTGKTIGIMNGQTMVMNEVFGETRVARYKTLKEFSMIASWAGTELAVLINTKHPYNSFDEMKGAKGLKAGATDPLGTHALSGAVTAEALNLQNFRLIVGYQSSNDLISNVFKGELDIFSSSYDTCKRYVDQNFAKVVGLLGKKSPLFPGAQTIADIDLTPEAKKWLEVMRDTRAILRLLVAPPGVPEERIKFISDAFWRVLENKTFQKELAKREMIFPGPGDYKETFKRIEKVLNLSEKDRKDFRFFVEKKYR
ncbi:tripartite tricarboxylate transporter substrate-binding protein [Thermodesulfobacteriota bacterium]